MLRRSFLQGLAALFAFPVSETKAGGPLTITINNPNWIPVELEPLVAPVVGQIMSFYEGSVDRDGIFRIVHKIWNGEEWMNAEDLRWEEDEDLPEILRRDA